MRIKLLFLGMFAIMTQTLAQSSYSSHSQLSTRLKALPAKSKLASVNSIGKSSGGKDIWAVTLSGGDHSKNKAVLIVAGADGRHPAGTEMAAKLAERLVSLPADSLTGLLQNKTIYIIPGLNPDALEQVSAQLKYERSGNAAARDDDRDGKTDEDPFEDLNGDGLITRLRIEDPTGNYVISKDDARVLVKADAAKGENGRYLLITEGTDNDKDGRFNEDGAGGVNIDKNFTYNYPMFEKEAGEYQASEPETRAFLDFLYKNTNIHTVFHFGLSNNLSEATRFDRANASKRIISGLQEKDAEVTDRVSKMYGKAGITDAPVLPQTPGNLTQTAYYHAGRFSYSTPGWWIPKAKDQKGGAPAKKPEAGNAEAEYLKWADAKGVNSFVPWTRVEHTDFPGKSVEVGGLMPYALNNPPVQFLDSAVIRHQAFFTDYLKAMPRTEIVNTKVESLGNGVSRVSVTVVNKGLLPTYPEIGERVRFVYKVSCKIKLSEGQTLISGKLNNYRGALDAGESEEYSWLISGKGKVTVEGGSPTSGISNLELTLK